MSGVVLQYQLQQYWAAAKNMSVKKKQAEIHRKKELRKPFDLL